MNKFSVFIKYGGGENASLLTPFFQKISKLFDEISKNKYVSKSIQFHIEIRIDGDMFSFNDIEGCSNLKYLKNKEVIANTIALKQKLVSDTEKAKIFSKDYLLIAIKQMSDRLISEKFEIDKDIVLNDIRSGLNTIT